MCMSRMSGTRISSQRSEPEPPRTRVHARPQHQMHSPSMASRCSGVAVAAGGSSCTEPMGLGAVPIDSVLDSRATGGGRGLLGGGGGIAAASSAAADAAAACSVCGDGLAALDAGRFETGVSERLSPSLHTDAPRLLSRYASIVSCKRGRASATTAAAASGRGKEVTSSLVRCPDPLRFVSLAMCLPWPLAEC